MSDERRMALLPTGLSDLLPPRARGEARAVERLVQRCEAHGYERVKPPLLEFEESLLAGAGSAVAGETFRLMDPVSQRMIGLRADMTPQVLRIAACRLPAAARPLRLCYAGQVLRQRGDQLRPERQFAQVGAELIGSDSAAADAEAILLAADALLDLGVRGLSVDLCLPSLVRTLSAALGLDERQTRLLGEAMDRKNAAAAAQVGGSQAEPLLNLLAAVGPLEMALPRLKVLALPPAAEKQVARLAEVAALLTETRPDLTLTLDPVEHRGHVYQTGLSFTLFGQGVRGELGRGGRYLADCLDGGSEPGTGFTLFADTVLRAIEPSCGLARIFLPLGTPRAEVEALQQEGWATVGGLASEPDAMVEARRLNCGHLWRDGAAWPVSPGAE